MFSFSWFIFFLSLSIRLAVHFYYSIFVCLPMFVSVYPCLSVPVCLSIHLSLTLSLLFPSFNPLPYSFSSLFSPLSLLSLRFSLSIFLPLCLFFFKSPSVSLVYFIYLCFSRIHSLPLFLFSPLFSPKLTLSLTFFLNLSPSPFFSYLFSPSVSPPILPFPPFHPNSMNVFVLVVYIVSL